jgi:ProP effector
MNANDTQSPVHLLLKQLRSSYPVFRNNLPLAIGIDKQIFAALPEVERKLLRATLTRHTMSTLYLQQFLKSEARSNLDGSAADKINEAHKLHAQKLLQERAKKNAERKAQQRELEKQEKIKAQEQQAAQQHAEKIKQLMEKFSTSKR